VQREEAGEGGREVRTPKTQEEREAIDGLGALLTRVPADKRAEAIDMLMARYDETTQDASPSCAPGAGEPEATATGEPSNPETCGRHRS
jgi:hypothetical protein